MGSVSSSVQMGQHSSSSPSPSAPLSSSSPTGASSRSASDAARRRSASLRPLTTTEIGMPLLAPGISTISSPCRPATRLRRIISLSKSAHDGIRPMISSCENSSRRPPTSPSPGNSSRCASATALLWALPPPLAPLGFRRPRMMLPFASKKSPSAKSASPPLAA